MDAPRFVLTPPPIDAPTALPAAQMDELRRTAQEFESMVLRELLGPMFEPLDTDGLGGGGAGERMFRPMLVGEYAQGMAARGGIGLADLVLAELVRLQGAQQPPPEA
jgi:peptidoglycan hydrolase FlgJ